MQVLDGYPRIRAGVYTTLALLGVGLGATQVAFLTMGVQPQWLTVVLAVYGFLASAGGLTAASNTPVPRRELKE